MDRMTEDDGRDNGKKAGRKNPWERGRKTEENEWVKIKS
jgi:hypothetical protein